ncbi:nitrite reductase [Streptomyces mashuensis]|uniref:Nitrite reductase n=1 Tax=Streptomyces mashuensis TaxID=33904 RepID=A0A919E8J3_9ACTN|nr:FAD-dependent oxidoreductase [Streptomyces mashuensis]GHF28799.1 nitrite reductase [Streptomyces mashuensis]
MTRPHRIAVAGAGMAAARLAQQLRDRTPPDAAEVTLYGAEPHPPYNRALLTAAVIGRHDPETLGLPYGDGTVLRTGTRVAAVDPAARVLRLSDGTTAPYDTLVLATGAAPVLPYELRGPRPARVHLLRTLADARALARDARDSARAVVVGGGVLGVSTAHALAGLGTRTDLVHAGPHLMHRHLDAGSAADLHRLLAGLGITARTGTRPTGLHGSPAVTAVTLADGDKLEADLVVLACGVRPRTGLARAAGLRVARGVVVDDRLTTSDPHVHAVGDCAEHRGTLHGLAGPAWDQADVLAARLADHVTGVPPRARHTGSRPVLRLAADGLHLAAFGDPAAPAGHDVLRLADARRGTSTRLVLHGDRLTGGVLLGDTGTAGDLLTLWRRADPLPGDPARLLVPEGAPT